MNYEFALILPENSAILNGVDSDLPYSRREFMEALEAYLGTLVWTDLYAENFDGEIESIDIGPIDSSILDDELIRISAKELADFLDYGADDIASLLDGRSHYLPQIAANFAFSRNGHGAGFMDCGSLASKNLLDKSRSFGSVMLCYQPEIQSERIFLG